MIKGKLWSQISLLEVTKVQRLIRRSIFHLGPNSKIEYFPTAIVEHKDFSDSQYIISPDNKYLIIWDIICILIIVFQSFYIPFILSFDLYSNNYWFFTETCTTLYFLLDIFLILNTAIYKDGSLITDRKQIMKKYIKSWLMIDFMSIIPYFLYPLPDSSTNNAFKNTYKILRLLGLFKLLRIVKLVPMIDKIKETSSHRFLSSLIMLVEIMGIEIFVAHLLACGFYAIGSYEAETHPNVWMNSCYLENDSILELYVTSMYWSITTMATVGYGDIKPQTPAEIGFVICAMVFSCIILGFVVGAIEVIVMNYRAMETKYRDMIVIMNAFMKKKSIPIPLQYKVRRYMDFLWELQKKNEVDETDILNMLSNELKELVCVYSRGHVFNNFYAFTKFDHNFLKKITLVITYNCFAPYDIIFEEGEKSRDIYFIREGEVILEDSKTNCVVKKLIKLNYFGEIAFFLGTPRSCSARAISFLETLTLLWNNFSELLQGYQEMADYINKLQSQPFEEALYEIGVECYFCKAQGHISHNCEFFLFGKKSALTSYIDHKNDSKSIKAKSIQGRLIPPKFLKFHLKRPLKTEESIKFLYEDFKSPGLKVKKSKDYSIYSESSESIRSSASSINRSSAFDNKLLSRISIVDDNL